MAACVVQFTLPYSLYLEARRPARRNPCPYLQAVDGCAQSPLLVRRGSEMRNIVTFARLGRVGRLCNGAFQIASTIGVARRNGFDFAFPLWRNHDGLNFESGIDIDVYKRFVNSLPLYEGPELPERWVDWGYHDITLTESTSLHGHMQSEKYFAHAIDEVRWYMRMKDEPPANDYVAIHWRAGDYGPQASPQHPDGNSYHPRMALSYYDPAMALFPGAKFLVFSDDIPAAREMFGDRVEYSEGRGYLDDFRLLKTCRHFIIANSSYSAFAAMLGDAKDKRVVAPYPWFGGPYTSQLDPADIYSEGWTIINYENGDVHLKKAA